MAVTAGERRENEIVAKRKEPDGTGAGGVISETRPYGYIVSCKPENSVRRRNNLL